MCCSEVPSCPVVSPAFEQLLLRPGNITVQVLGSDLTIRRMGKIVLGSAIFVLALQLTDITWTAVKLAYLPVVVLSMGKLPLK